ncbi:rod shape-determining protein MreD [Wenzhouxiangella sediminis]|uniref:Rod shape-determining protein MreD n=1 Tax=Wenzhouxiangella sediminis TaxID=1792836 RepID=A0A3E1KA00_9GAMM|nr:rod shape-determining protein MreD [Wenzhouxiangella sediminis]RFF31088.1 rod shape-determining protein MreD [Wenzhouxiangella sediminis]
MSKRGVANWTMALSLIAVLPLTLMPLPDAFSDARPYWAALVMIYWNLEAGRLRHLGQAFLGGLVLDVLTASLLGQHALSLVIISYLVERFRYRIRFFPPWQQAAVVMLLLFNDRIVQLWIIGLVGDRWPTWQWWLAPVIGMLLWPWLFLLLDALRQKERRRPA